MSRVRQASKHEMVTALRERYWAAPRVWRRPIGIRRACEPRWKTRGADSCSRSKGSTRTTDRSSSMGASWRTADEPAAMPSLKLRMSQCALDVYLLHGGRH